MSKTYRADKVQLQWNRKTGDAATTDVLRGCIGCELRSICYAAKMARTCGIDFFQPVERTLDTTLFKKQVEAYSEDWIRIGCISDPSLDWAKTCVVTDIIWDLGKIPVIVTKIHKEPSEGQKNFLFHETSCQFQVSVSALMGSEAKVHRERFLVEAAEVAPKDTIMRLNSAAWVKDSKQDDEQKRLIALAKYLGIQILETPIRLFKTSPIWNLVDQSRYHRHLSPISGKLDNQQCAGLVIPDAYACYSTCSPTPTENDPVGCWHQCCTLI